MNAGGKQMTSKAGAQHWFPSCGPDSPCKGACRGKAERAAFLEVQRSFRSVATTHDRECRSRDPVLPRPYKCGRKCFWLLPLRVYFAASFSGSGVLASSTNLSKRGSPRNGSQNGSSFNVP